MLKGTQAAEVDCVGVHAFAAGHVGTRDPGVDRTKSLSEKEVETSWALTCCGRLRHFVAANGSQAGPQVSSLTVRRNWLFGAAYVSRWSDVYKALRCSGARSPQGADFDFCERCSLDATGKLSLDHPG